MRKLDEKGGLLLPLIITILLLLGSLGFGAWAFAGRQEYKNKSDIKSSEAVTAAEEKLIVEKNAEFAEKEKLPYTTYTGPAAFGTITVNHPKTWSVYVDETGGNTLPLSGYMHPRFVPGNPDTNFAFRFEVSNRGYDQELKTLEPSVKSGKLNLAAYRLPKVSSVLGSRVEGEISTKKQGVMVILPLRDKAIKIWTEGNEFRADFDKMLADLTFAP